MDEANSGAQARQERNWKRDGQRELPGAKSEALWPVVGLGFQVFGFLGFWVFGVFGF